MSDCIFCRIAKKELPVELVYEDEKFVAFRDIHPVAATHILFVPKEHIPTLNDLDQGHSEMLGQMFRAIAKVAAKEGVAEKGYRVVTNVNHDGGQEVFHLHVHLLGGRPLGKMG